MICPDCEKQMFGAACWVCGYFDHEEADRNAAKYITDFNDEKENGEVAQ